jgi:hypothetical protein
MLLVFRLQYWRFIFSPSADRLIGDSPSVPIVPASSTIGTGSCHVREKVISALKRQVPG